MLAKSKGIVSDDTIEEADEVVFSCFLSLSVLSTDPSAYKSLLLLKCVVLLLRQKMLCFHFDLS